MRKLAAMEVHHEKFTFQEFAEQLPELRAARRVDDALHQPVQGHASPSSSGAYHEIDDETGGLSTWQWKLRNEVWSHLAPLWGYHVSRLVSWKWLQLGA